MLKKLIFGALLYISSLIMESITYNGQKSDYQDLIDNGYEFKLGDYINKGWEIAKQNVGGFIGFSITIPIFLILVYALIISLFFVLGRTGILVGAESVMGIFGLVLLFIVYIGLIISMYCLYYGYFIVADKIYHEEYYSFGHFFDAFIHWKQLMYYKLLSFLILLGAMIPYFIVLGLFLMPMMKGDVGDPDDLKYSMMLMPLSYLFILPSYYFMIIFSFSPLLIIFGRLNYLDAMYISRKIIQPKFFWFLLFYLVLGIIAYIGAFALLIGMLFSIPVAMCIYYAAYQEILGVKGSYLENKIDEIGINEDTIQDNSW